VTQPRSHIAIIALGLLLIVFGHDAAMTTDPHDVAVADVHAAHHDDAQTPPDDAPCGPVEGVRPQPLDDDMRGDAPAPCLVVPEGIAAAIPSAPRWWSEPDHPPDVRRALLQVFLN
jgi:hypothetical protein